MLIVRKAAHVGREAAGRPGFLEETSPAWTEALLRDRRASLNVHFALLNDHQVSM
ncbi:hypothetical protein [Alkalicoccus chagannorensis]|uniref:hypothetical protein n=1 Tax=Alkalicoccus chagannorensis TaxID=427072 RepID=UPI0012EBD59E|nr:hypothetical protein [Alkalicoccus chagannorensis]